MTDAVAPLSSRASLRRALGLRTVVTTSTGLAFAALEYLAAAGLVAYVAGDSAWIPILVAGVLALLAYGFFGELNGMFPTAAAIRLYMKQAMDDRVALTITFTYLTTIILVIASDAFIVGSALAHAFGESAWVAAIWIVGLLAIAVVTNLRGITVAGLLQDAATSVVIAATLVVGDSGPRAQRPRPAHTSATIARSSSRGFPRSGRPRCLPLQRLRMGDDERRGGAQALVHQPGHAHRHRHPVRRLRGGHGRHEPHAVASRAHVGLSPALPRHGGVRARRAVGDGGGDRHHRAEHVQRGLHHRLPVHLRDSPRRVPAPAAGPAERPGRALGPRRRARRALGRGGAPGGGDPRLAGAGRRWARPWRG